MQQNRQNEHKNLKESNDSADNDILIEYANDKESIDDDDSLGLTQEELQMCRVFKMMIKEEKMNSIVRRIKMNFYCAG